MRKKGKEGVMAGTIFSRDQNRRLWVESGLLRKLQQ